MKYIRHDLGQLYPGDIVKVHISYAANVQLMTPDNFYNYHRGRKYRYYGGYRNISPVQFEIPFQGFWHVTVDLGVRVGTVLSSIVIVKKDQIKIDTKAIESAIQNALENLKQIQENIHQTKKVSEYDTFINHATEDKLEFVNPLVSELEARGVKVWYDKNSIKLGEGLRSSIDKGLSKCKFGIVALSKAYFGKDRTQAELDALFAMGTQLLPIWHGVVASDVKSFSPLMVGKKALKTSDFTIVKIADEIAKMVNNPKEEVESEGELEEQERNSN